MKNCFIRIATKTGGRNVCWTLTVDRYVTSGKWDLDSPPLHTSNDWSTSWKHWTPIRSNLVIEHERWNAFAFHPCKKNNRRQWPFVSGSVLVPGRLVDQNIDSFFRLGMLCLLPPAVTMLGVSLHLHDSDSMKPPVWGQALLLYRSTLLLVLVTYYPRGNSQPRVSITFWSSRSTSEIISPTSHFCKSALFFSFCAFSASPALFSRRRTSNSTRFFNR